MFIKFINLEINWRFIFRGKKIFQIKKIVQNSSKICGKILGRSLKMGEAEGEGQTLSRI